MRAKSARALRYYYGISYDWDRLDYLMRKFQQAWPRVRDDLAVFLNFLRQMESSA
ncbi:MAG: hypothetical protein K8T26_03365 [Lentisphaerae bacterium]|nr:hypothetical protein [Lentisphaerota bacterium]